MLEARLDTGLLLHCLKRGFQPINSSQRTQRIYEMTMEMTHATYGTCLNDVICQSQPPATTAYAAGGWHAVKLWQTRHKT